MTQAPKRHWLFSLRGLLLAAVVVACLAALAVNPLRTWQRQSMVDSLVERGGKPRFYRHGELLSSDTVGSLQIDEIVVPDGVLNPSEQRRLERLFSEAEVVIETSKPK